MAFYEERRINHAILYFYDAFARFILTLLFLLKWRCSMGKLENKFQADLIKEIKSTFDGCIVTKLDAKHIQGIPDLAVFYNDRWATLECKKDKNASKQPNQEYYVNKMNGMSFSRFIEPENKEEVLNELKVHFRKS